MSHIAYDVFVDTMANFPLLAPFNFNDVLIPHIYALPIEVAAILLVYFWYSIKSKGTFSNHSRWMFLKADIILFWSHDK